jgi:hypothetical protein
MHKHKYIKILNIYMLLYLCKSDSPIKKKKLSSLIKNSGSAPAQGDGGAALTGGRREGREELKILGERIWRMLEGDF